MHALWDDKGTTNWTGQKLFLKVLSCHFTVDIWCKQRGVGGGGCQIVSLCFFMSQDKGGNFLTGAKISSTQGVGEKLCAFMLDPLFDWIILLQRSTSTSAEDMKLQIVFLLLLLTCMHASTAQGKTTRAIQYIGTSHSLGRIWEKRNGEYLLLVWNVMSKVLHECNLYTPLFLIYPAVKTFPNLGLVHKRLGE